ncbi:MAG TPA: alpha/beta hydrolase [Candidatus Binatia bacterium]|nr:alpha/beta hydrolase [Candidatus Binatia bacterium]
MPLDPKARELLDQLAALGSPPLNELPVPEARQLLASLLVAPEEPARVAKVENRSIPGSAGAIPIRIYTPEGTPPFPVLVWLHGGGWVLGSLETHDALCRSLARAVPAVVVAVDYRLAPEHKFPAAAEDAYAATAWVAAHAGEIGADARRVAVGGDSAGGNLAAVVSLMARDRGGPRLAHQLLVYPATDAGLEHASMRENADGYWLTRDMMAWFWNLYLGGARDGGSPLASPLRAQDLRGLPPATVITAEFDPLRDEGEAYAARLRAAGVPVDLRRWDGMIHGFFAMETIFPQGRAAVEHAAAALRDGVAR